MEYDIETYVQLKVIPDTAERIMLGMTLKHKRPNVWLRQTTKFTDIAVKVAKLKCTYQQHVAGSNPGRW